MVDERERRARERAKQDKAFKDIEDSLSRATDLIDQSKAEVGRSRRLMKESDDARDAENAKRDKDEADRSS